MSQLRVVVTAAYPVPDHRGVHLAPGVVATVQKTPEVVAHLEAGRLTEVVQPERPAKSVEKRAPRVTPEPIEEAE